MSATTQDGPSRVEEPIVKALPAQYQVCQQRCLIAATHFPFVSNHGAYFLKLYQSRSCVVALENAPDVGGAAMAPVMPHLLNPEAAYSPGVFPPYRPT